MNKLLLEQIVKHILANLLVIPSNFIDPNKSNSLLSKEFLLDKTISFELGDGTILNNKVWGCQMLAEDRELKLILTNCKYNKDIITEFFLIVQLKNAPAYGLYFENENGDALLACNIQNSGWMNCNTYLQATFLAGMEQLKENNLHWNKCKNYDEQYKLLLSFIEYHDSLGDD